MLVAHSSRSQELSATGEGAALQCKGCRGPGQLAGEQSTGLLVERSSILRFRSVHHLTHACALGVHDNEHEHVIEQPVPRAKLDTWEAGTCGLHCMGSLRCTRCTACIAWCVHLLQACTAAGPCLEGGGVQMADELPRL